MTKDKKYFVLFILVFSTDIIKIYTPTGLFYTDYPPLIIKLSEIITGSLVLEIFIVICH